MQKTPDMSVIHDLQEQMRDAISIARSLSQIVGRRCIKYNQYSNSANALSSGQIKTDKNQRECAMWFRVHANCIRAKIVQIQAGI
jgi:hypothetical protein